MIETTSKSTSKKLTEELNRLGVKPISIVWTGYEFVAFYEEKKKSSQRNTDKKGKK